MTAVYADTLMDAEGGYRIGTVARSLGYTVREFHRLLRDIGATEHVERRTLPNNPAVYGTQDWINKGWIVVPNKTHRGGPLLTATGIERAQELIERRVIPVQRAADSRVSDAVARYNLCDRVARHLVDEHGLTPRAAMRWAEILDDSGFLRAPNAAERAA